MSNPVQLSRVRDFVVVGGGIAGTTIAYELARRGEQVTLLEQGALAGAASGRNMGLLLNQVEPESLRMMEHALSIYREVEGSARFSLRKMDQLLLARERSQVDDTIQRVAALRAAGLQVDVVEPDWLWNTWPALGRDVAAGALVRDAWLLDPGAATRAFALAARAAGAAIRTHVRVAAAHPDGVLTDEGRFPADAVVVATGPWLPDLVPDAPVSAGRGWVLRTGRLTPPCPWIVEEMSWPDQGVLGRASRAPTLGEVAAGGYDTALVRAFGVAPQPGGGVLLGASLAPSLRDAVEGVEAPSGTARHALLSAPGLHEVPVVAAWYGMRPMAPDGVPIAGQVRGGLWVHGGHGSIGMQAAPATARWLVDAMLGGTTGPDLARLSPRRFDR